MMGTTGIASVVVSFLLSVLTLFNGLPIGNISNNAAHWDKEQIAEERLQQMFDYFDAVMQQSFDGPVYITQSGDMTTEPADDTLCFEVDFSSLDNFLLFTSKVTSDENFYGGDFVKMDYTALEGKTYSGMKAIDLVYDAIQFVADNAELISTILTQGFDFGILGQVMPDIFSKNGLMGKLDVNALLTAAFSNLAGYNLELTQNEYGAIVLARFNEEHKQGECRHPGENTFHDSWGWTYEEWNEETQEWEWVEYIRCYTALTAEEKASYSLENSLVKIFRDALYELIRGFGASEEDAFAFAQNINTANMGMYAIIPYVVRELVNIGSDNLGDDIIHFLRQAFVYIYGAANLHGDFDSDDIRVKGIRGTTYEDEYEYNAYLSEYNTLCDYYYANFEDGDYALFDYELTIDDIDFKMFEASYKENGELVFYPYEETVSGKEIDKVIESVFDVRFAVPSDYTPDSSARGELVVDPATDTKYYVDEDGAVYELYESVFPVAGEVDHEVIRTLTDEDIVAMRTLGIYADGSFTQIDIDRTYCKDGYFYTHNDNEWKAWTLEENTTFYKNLNASLADLCALVNPYFVFNNNQYDFIDGARQVGSGFADQLNNIIATLLANSWTEEGLAELNWIAGSNEHLNDNIMKFIRTVTARLFSAGTSTDLGNLSILLREMGESEGADLLDGIKQFFNADYYKTVNLERIVVDIALAVIDTTDILFSETFEMPENIDSIEKLTACLVIAATDEVFPALHTSSEYIRNGRMVDKSDVQWKEVILDKGFELVMRLWAKENDASAVIFTTEEIDNYKLQGWTYMDFLDEIVDRMYVYIEGLVAVCDDLQCQLGIYDGNGPWYKLSKLLNALLPTSLFSGCDKNYGDEYLPFDIGVFLEEAIAGNVLDFDVSGLLNIVTENASDFNPFYGNNFLKGLLICAQNLINAVLPGTIKDEDIVTPDHLIQNETLAKVFVQLFDGFNARKTQLVPAIVSCLELFGIFETLPFVDKESGFCYFIREDEDGQYVSVTEYFKKINLDSIVEVPAEINGLPVKGYEMGSSVEGATVHLPDSIRYFTIDSYYSGINRFTVNGSNPFLEVADDVLYNEDMTEILSYPNDKTDEIFIVPSTVKNIYASTFSNAVNLRVLKINEGTQGIYYSPNENDIWERFGNLKEIYIPASVEYIDPDVFNTYQMQYAVIHGQVGSYAQQYYLENANTFSDNLSISFEVYIPDELFLTFNTEKQAVKSNIYVYGYTMPDATIKVYDGDELIGKDNNIQISKNSKWEANVPLYKPVDSGSYHDITVVAEKDGETVTSQTITVYYEKGAVVFKEFKMIHAGHYTVTVTDDNINRPHSMTWIPGDNSDIRVRVLNSKKLVSLYLVAKEGRTEYRVELERSENDYWLAKNCFLGDPPGVIRLEGVIKNNNKFETVQIGGDIKITFLIDPSGNVYEFNTANPLADVTTTVQYYDETVDEWVIWDAEYYNQINPCVTTTDGAFKWIVPKGQWRVVCEKDGYEEYISEAYDIPPEVTGLQYFMTTNTAPTVKESFFADGVVTITFDQYMTESVLDASAYTVDGADVTGIDYAMSDWDHNDFTMGYKTVRLTCTDADGYPLAQAPACVTLNNVYNYANIAIATNTTIVPTDLTKYYNFTVSADKTDATVGDVVTITLATEEEITDAVNVTVSNPAIFDSEYYVFDEFGDIAQTIDASIPENLTFDENGEVSFALVAGFEGSSTLKFKVGGSEVTYTVYINAKAQNDPHVHVYGDAIVVQSTCLLAGYSYQECECGDILYTAYELAAHTPVEIVNEDTLRSKATCRAKATYYYTCDVCDMVLKDGEVFEDGTVSNADYFASGDLLKHDFDENGACKNCPYIEMNPTPACKHANTTTTDISATCTEDGLEGKIVCDDCGETVNEGTVVDALDHDIVVDKGFAPTCEETGLTDGQHCSRCNDATVAQTAIPALGHKEETILGKAATCSTTGLTDGKKCTVCGEITVAQAEIAKISHNKVTINQTPATATEDGYTGDVVCSVCDELLEEGNIIPATGEEDNNCDHLCHKDGIMGIFWKIIRFFWKLFKMNPVCSCGEAHY
ncbi:MAG: hypothetical protein IKB13_03165 [Clostridia bacterium]|nr:hypothetical protein [Clostridia bacterium]